MCYLYGGEGISLSDSICSITAGVLTKLEVCNATDKCEADLPNIYGVILGILFLSDSLVYSLRAT